MNESILNNVNRISGSLSFWQVCLLLLITLAGAVLMIVVCTGGLAAVKALWNRLFCRKN